MPFEDINNKESKSKELVSYIEQKIKDSQARQQANYVFDNR